ncbi:hypothetical protein ACWC5I_11940 [Kitasatospora sp. NPDC001574]
MSHGDRVVVPLKAGQIFALIADPHFPSGEPDIPRHLAGSRRR